jgi:hypothetical protein
MILPVVVVVTVLAIVSFVVLYFSNNHQSSNNLTAGDNKWSCGNKGCKPNIYGEHGSEEACVRICSSFVNEGSGCVKTLGVPWNSFSDLSSCRQNT